ncbi:MAG: cysteine--tRNA ligase [Candidatus Nanopelagicales bacterium]
MSLRLHDTATRSVRDFVPLEPGKVTMYLCGATVQSAPHVGHVRSSLVFDVLSRWLRISGYEVVLCRNVTDIDDKILARSVEQDRPWWAVAHQYELEFQQAYDVLGCVPPTVEPRATGHVTQMVEMIAQLLERGHAYESGGDVYFDVRSYAEYGALSGQKPDDLQPGADSELDTRKRNPRDFALWKAAKPGEPSWPTPWGDGRPGWHLECSAMARTYLGAQFDIHGGGLDLVFPHHENEIAQSRGAGDAFAQYWLHNAWVTTAGEKMSKSLGNSMVMAEVLRRVRPVELRWYLVAAHYRSNLEFSDDSLAESAAGYRRIEGFVKRAAARVGPSGVDPTEQLPKSFVDAMNDDLSVPAAVAVVHERVTEGNRLLAARDDEGLVPVLAEVRSMLDVIGVDPLSPPWAGSDADDERLRAALDALVTAEIGARQEARAGRDFAAADAIRDRIVAAGISIEDSADGSRWSLAGDS